MLKRRKRNDVAKADRVSITLRLSAKELEEIDEASYVSRKNRSMYMLDAALKEAERLAKKKTK